MAAALALLGASLGFLAGIAVGLWAGRRVRDKHQAWYWSLNALFLVVGLVVDVAGLTLGLSFVAFFGLGLIPGGITGLKYGYGRIVGLWAVMDRVGDTMGAMGRHAEVTDRKGNDLTDPLGRRSDRVDPKQGLGRPGKRP